MTITFLNKNKHMKKDKIILTGEFTKFATASYPGRIYGMYDWDDIKCKWVLNEEFCKKYGIDINKN